MMSALMALSLVLRTLHNKLALLRKARDQECLRRRVMDKRAKMPMPMRMPRWQVFLVLPVKLVMEQMAQKRAYQRIYHALQLVPMGRS